MTTATQTARGPKATNPNTEVSGTPQSTDNFVRNPQIAFWKPFQGKGCAIFFEYNASKKCVFFEMRPETQGGTDDDPKFDKDRRVLSKLGFADLGEMLAVIKGRKEGAGLNKDGKGWSMFHKNANGNTAITFERTENGIRVGMSAKVGDAAANRQSANITVGEATLLEIFLTNAVTGMCG